MASYAYVATGLAYRAFPFLILPWLTSVLTVEEYARLGLYLTFVAVGSTIVGLKPEVYLLMRVGDLGDYQRFCREGVLQSVLLLALATTLIFIAVSEVFVRLYFSGYGLPAYYTGVAGLHCLLLCCYRSSLACLQGFRQVNAYVYLECFLIAVSLIFIVIWVSEWGIWEGRVLGELLALSATLAILVYRSLKLRSLMSISPRALFRSLRHTLVFLSPLLGHALAFVLIGMVIRALVVSELGLTEGGVFILAATVASIVSFSHEALMRAWNPFYYDNIRDVKNIQSIRLMQLRYSAGSVILFLGFLVFVNWGFDVFFSKKYGEAKMLAAWLGFAYTLEGLRKVLASYIYVSGKRYLISVISFVGVVVSIFVFQSLVSLGALAGALAMCSAFGFTLLATIIVRLFISQKP